MNKWLSGAGRSAAALLLLGCTLFSSGCADDAFLPPPENQPYGQSQPEEGAPPSLQPPVDL